MEVKTIIVINDNTAEAEHAALQALKIAQKETAHIILANEVKVATSASTYKYTLTENRHENDGNGELHHGLLETLKFCNDRLGQNKIEIREIDISNFVVEDLSRFIIKNNIWMIVKGTHPVNNRADALHINIQYVLNKVMCPLLLVPAA
ncbi:MAG TPA: universal stress protein, partial [Mucilaginibacter sp.]|nr:universal stress protein [Mucilaginibacter sp.]